MANEEINKIDEENEEIEEIEENDEKEKTTIKKIKNDKETDYSKTIREGVLELSSYSMLDNEKRKRFVLDLKKMKL